jgi:hypothetical protein
VANVWRVLVHRSLAEAGPPNRGPPYALPEVGDVQRAAPVIWKDPVARMHRQVDYHLAQTRGAESRANAGERCAAGKSAEGLARTM